MFNKRVAYTDNEIANLMKMKMKENKHNADDLFSLYKDKYSIESIALIQKMLSGTSIYNVKMLDIASEYLNISYDDLTNIIEDNDDASFRKGASDEEAENFINLVSGLFSEIIRQKKLNR